MPKRKLHCLHDSQEGDRKIPRRTRSRWKRRKINDDLCQFKENTLQSSTCHESIISCLPEGMEPSISAQTQDLNILPCPSQPAEIFFSEVQDNNLPTHLLQTDKMCSSEVQQDFSHARAPETEELHQTAAQHKPSLPCLPEAMEPSTSTQRQDLNILPCPSEPAEDFFSEVQDNNLLTHLLQTDEMCSSEVQQNFSHALAPQTKEMLQTALQDNSPLTETAKVCTSSTEENATKSATDASWLNILAFCLKHNVTGTLMEDLLKLLRLYSPDPATIPRSKYMLEKDFNDFVVKSEYHHYCGECGSYIGVPTPEEKADIDHARDSLELYVKSVERLYSDDQMTFNGRSLLHLSTSVENLGPLWAQSAFMFENYNGYLLKQVKSSNAVPQQICKRVAWPCALPQIIKTFSPDDMSPENIFFPLK